MFNSIIIIWRKLFIDLIFDVISITIGRWSDPSDLTVVHSITGSRDKLAKDISGEVGWPFDGSLVGISSFRTPKLESVMKSERSLPLLSSKLECQSVS